MWNVIDDYQLMCNQMTVSEYYDFWMKVAYPMNHDIEYVDIWNAIMDIFNKTRTVREFLSYYIFF